MTSKKTTIVNPMGMHMRPAQLFIQTVTPFNCDVILLANGKEINGKSIMNLMAACIKQGAEVEVRCDGPDEEKALKAIIELIDSGPVSYTHLDVYKRQVHHRSALPHLSPDAIHVDAVPGAQLLRQVNTVDNQRIVDAAR